jgi:D-alanyl-lipoteichoic acid acyltransferase DltB (MBOAT superfamily)
VNLTDILIFTLVAGLVGRFGSARTRPWLLLAASILAIYWMQPSTPVRNLDFWLPTASIALAGLVWALTLPTPRALTRADALSAAFTIGISLLVSLTRYLEPLCCLTPTRPPATLQVLLALALAGASGYLAARLLAGRRAWLSAFLVAILVLFVVLKSEALAQAASAALRSLSGQDPTLATPFDIRWLGFSYVAFRLLHTIRDRLAGRLPELSLQEYLIYVIFFPAYNAGPIDRVQRFIQDLRQPFTLSSPQLYVSGRRLLTGIFNKFVLADTLAIVALNATNANQVQSGGWMWLILYAYALRIYLDFSGYTDIALGLGILLGVRLPENFDHPYRKPNLTAFWNAWHITLAQWFRGYYFNPLTRALRTGQRKIPLPLIIFIGQTTTMLLIGLWHGISWNFAIWGLWHGVGLFLHNRWQEFVRPRLSGLEQKPRLSRLLQAGGTLLTFHYVALGWVWFALPSLDLSLGVFASLLRI